MTGVSAEQSGLSSYAEAVLRHNGIKSCRTRWPSDDVLSIEVDPMRLQKAERLLPIIQQRAGADVRVEMHQPSPETTTPRIPDAFDE
jgi:hypothetical protein